MSGPVIPARFLEIQALKSISPFKIHGDLALEDIQNVHAPDEAMAEFAPEDIDIYAGVSVSHSGELPESARVLNAIVMDYVDANRTDLENLVLPSIRTLLSENYPEMDTSPLEGPSEGLLNADQVDYHAGIDPQTGKLHFDVEILLDFEEQ